MSATVYDLRTFHAEREKYLPPAKMPWQTARVKQVYDVRLGKMLQPEQRSVEDIQVPYLKALHVQWGSVGTEDLPQMWTSGSDLKNYEVRNGDLLICEGGEVGRGAIIRNLHHAAIIQNSLHRVRSTEFALNEFLLYCMDHISHSGWLDVVCNKATIAHLTGEKLGELKIYLPTLEEQRRVVSFLEIETNKLDQLIEKKRRLIELLQEKRQALITEAVTKGLDPNVPMKDSGTLWLGVVPAHWKVVRLKFIAEVRSGVTKGRDLSGKETIDLPYLRVANVQDGYLDLSDVTTIPVLPHEVERYSLRNGDVLMNEGGDFDKLGRGTRWNAEIDPCLHQNHVFAVRPTDMDYSDWINAYTGSEPAKRYFIMKSKQTTNLASISSSNIQELPILLPGRDERHAILSRLSQATERLDKAASLIGRQIETIREYRQALISAAVTGQIDVGQYVPEVEG